MLTFVGKLFEASVVPGRTLRDGQIIAEKHVIQVTSKDQRGLTFLQEIKVKEAKAYDSQVGKEIKVPVRIYIPKEGNGKYYLTADE